MELLWNFKNSNKHSMFRISENLENPCDECEEVGAEKVETETTHENSNFLLRF